MGQKSSELLLHSHKKIIFSIVELRPARGVSTCHMNGSHERHGWLVKKKSGGKPMGDSLRAYWSVGGLRLMEWLEMRGHGETLLRMTSGVRKMDILSNQFFEGGLIFWEIIFCKTLILIFRRLNCYNTYRILKSLILRGIDVFKTNWYFGTFIFFAKSWYYRCFNFYSQGLYDK